MECFDPPNRNDIKTNETIQKIDTGQRDDYTTGCTLEHKIILTSKKFDGFRFK